MAESKKPDATGQAGNIFVSPSDTSIDIIDKVADVLSFLSIADADFGDRYVMGRTLSPRRGSNLILEACADALVIVSERGAA